MRWGILAVLLLLVGCSGLSGVSPDIDYEVVVKAVVDECDAPPGRNTDPPTAMEVGFAKVQAACEGFFVKATRAQQAALASNQSLDAGLAGATAIITATNSAAAAGKALAITGAGVVLGKALVNDYMSIYAFDTHLYKVRQLVQNSMEDYIAKARASPPRNYCLAYTYIQKFAMLCSLAAMKANLDSQVAVNLPITTSPPPPAGPPRPGALGAKLGMKTSNFLQTNGSGPPPGNYSVQQPMRSGQ